MFESVKALKDRIRLAYVECTDTVNTWRCKINAIIKMINNRELCLSAIHYGDLSA